MKSKRLSSILWTSFFALACSGTATQQAERDGGNRSNPSGDGDGDGDGAAGASGENTPLPGGDDDEFLAQYRPQAAVAALTHVDACDELLTGIQNDFLVRVALVAEQLKRDIDSQAANGSLGMGGSSGFPMGPGFGGAPAFNPGGTAGAFVGVGGSANGGSIGGPMFGGSGAGGASSGASGGSSAGGSGTMVPGSEEPLAGPPPNNSGPIAEDDSTFSGTNNQEAEVDEADIIKADGNRLFLVHGNNLAVIDAWPAESAELAGSIVIEGSPRDLFIRGERAVVFSDIWDPWAAGLITDPNYYYFAGATKVTVLDVSASIPVVEREIYLEGYYVSSRRHDDTVRTVVQNGARTPQVPYPYLEYYDLFGNPYPAEVLHEQVDEWMSRIISAVRGSELDDWVSREWVRNDGVLEQLPPRCADYYLPAPGVTHPGVTSVISFDLTASQPELGGASIFGMAERVYASADALVLANADARFDSQGVQGEQTLLHRFALSAASTSYEASGFVPGRIHNQFSLDAVGNTVRVSTTERRWDGFNPEEPWNWIPPAPVNRVLVLETQESELVTIGQTQEFAHDEEIYATRFIGNRGYVVTFRQTDPFFVIDLTDPTDPHLVGELKIPGFSEYLHPIGANHLLALGRDTQEVEGGFVDLGQAMQIFDVTDPTAPELTHKYVFEGEGSSEANVNHHAISFHPEQNLIAFPYSSWWPQYSHALEVFSVDVTAGFERLGGVQYALPDAECFAYLGYDESWLSCYTPADQELILNDWRAQCSGIAQFKRGVFRSDFVYGVSNIAVQIHALEDLATPVANVDLPSEYGHYDYAGNGAGGSSGVGGSSPGFAGAAGSGGVYNPYGCQDVGQGGSAGTPSMGSGGAGGSF